MFVTLSELQVTHPRRILRSTNARDLEPAISKVPSLVRTEKRMQSTRAELQAYKIARCGVMSVVLLRLDAFHPDRISSSATVGSPCTLVESSIFDICEYSCFKLLFVQAFGD